MGSASKDNGLEGLEFDGDTVLCRVCGDKASGFHYGVHACEGCKGFFRRSIQQKIQYRPCLKNQQCNIMRVNRNRCQYCRLKKCIAVGMSRDAVRFGRVPKKEKAKIIEQMQKVNTQAHGNVLNAVLENEADVVSKVIAAHNKTCDFTKAKFETFLQKAWNTPEFVECPAHMACPLNPSPETSDGSKRWEDFSECFTPAIRNVVSFAKCIPGFQVLSQEDQVTLLKAGTFEVLLVHLACLFDSQTNTMMFTNGKLFKRGSHSVTNSAGFLLDSMFDFAERLNAMMLTDDEIALFSAIVIIASDRPGLRNVEQVERVQNRITQGLQGLMARNHPEDPALFAKLLMKIPDLRTLNTLHSEKLLGLTVPASSARVPGCPVEKVSNVSESQAASFMPGAGFPPGFGMYPPHLMAAASAAQSQFLQPEIQMSIATGNHGNQMLPNSFASFHHYNSLHAPPFDGGPSTAPAAEMNHKSLPNTTNKPIDKRKEGGGNAFLNNFKSENGFLPLPHGLPVRAHGKGSLSPRSNNHIGEMERSQGMPIIPTSIGHMMNPMMYPGGPLGWSPVMAPLDMDTIKALANRVDKPEDGASTQKRPSSPHNKDRDLKKFCTWEKNEKPPPGYNMPPSPHHVNGVDSHSWDHSPHGSSHTQPFEPVRNDRTISETAPRLSPPGGSPKKLDLPVLKNVLSQPPLSAQDSWSSWQQKAGNSPVTMYEGEKRPPEQTWQPMNDDRAESRLNADSHDQASENGSKCSSPTDAYMIHKKLKLKRRSSSERSTPEDLKRMYSSSDLHQSNNSSPFSAKLPPSGEWTYLGEQQTRDGASSHDSPSGCDPHDQNPPVLNRLPPERKRLSTSSGPHGSPPRLSPVLDLKNGSQEDYLQNQEDAKPVNGMPELVSGDMNGCSRRASSDSTHDAVRRSSLEGAVTAGMTPRRSSNDDAVFQKKSYEGSMVCGESGRLTLPYGPITNGSSPPPSEMGQNQVDSSNYAVIMRNNGLNPERNDAIESEHGQNDENGDSHNEHRTFYDEHSEMPSQEVRPNSQTSASPSQQESPLALMRKQLDRNGLDQEQLKERSMNGGMMHARMREEERRYSCDSNGKIANGQNENRSNGRGGGDSFPKQAAEENCKNDMSVDGKGDANGVYGYKGPHGPGGSYLGMAAAYGGGVHPALVYQYGPYAAAAMQQQFAHIQQMHIAQNSQQMAQQMNSQPPQQMAAPQHPQQLAHLQQLHLAQAQFAQAQLYAQQKRGDGMEHGKDANQNSIQTKFGAPLNLSTMRGKGPLLMGKHLPQPGDEADIKLEPV